VYSADPRVVPTARRIATLSYEETQEMAECGAKVLNAQAVEFAKDKGIAIYARATRGSLPGVDPSTDGTVVRRNPPRMPGTVVGVASERDLIVLEADVAASELLALLEERQVSGKQLHIFGDHTTVAISRDNLHDEERLRDLLQSRLSGRARLVDGLGAVSVVGAGINATYANVLSGEAALAAIGIRPAGTATSSFRITWMIPREQTDDAVRALHERFIDRQETLVP
jgi:aspartate kinase